MTVEITLRKVVETVPESPAELVQKQSATIIALQKKNEDFEKRLEILEKNYTRLQVSFAEKVECKYAYFEYNDLSEEDKEKLQVLLMRDPEFLQYSDKEYPGVSRGICFNKFINGEFTNEDRLRDRNRCKSRSRFLWSLSVMYCDGWEVADCEFDQCLNLCNCKFRQITPQAAYRKYFIDDNALSCSGKNVVVRRSKIGGFGGSCILSYTDY